MLSKLPYFVFQLIRLVFKPLFRSLKLVHFILKFLQFELLIS
jgi:hypothetical protein